ncbi:MAG: AAA family ATPase [Planctomycetes bacterium]|nr:AAA family ATPase [Planctomycetota bacterium]
MSITEKLRELAQDSVDEEGLDSFGSLDTQIISLLLDDSEWAGTVLPMLEPLQFTTDEHRVIIMKMKEFYECDGIVPTRDLLWDRCASELTPDDRCFPDVKAAIYRPSDLNEVSYVRTEITQFARVRTLKEGYESDEAMAAIYAGDVSYLADLVEKVQRIGTSQNADHLLDVDQLWDEEEEQGEWIIEGVLSAGQPLMIGGPSKSFKTSLATDLALSVASGKPYLGKYKTNRKRVLFMSGESGRRDIGRLTKTIAKERGITRDDLADTLTVSFERQTISTKGGLFKIKQDLERTKAEVLIIDPLYLSLDIETGGSARP